jgi:hypothetical protein
VGEVAGGAALRTVNDVPLNGTVPSLLVVSPSAVTRRLGDRIGDTRSPPALPSCRQSGTPTLQLCRLTAGGLCWGLVAVHFRDAGFNSTAAQWVTDDLEHLGFPPDLLFLFPVIKGASAAGPLAGLRWPPLGRMTAGRAGRVLGHCDGIPCARQGRAPALRIASSDARVVRPGPRASRVRGGRRFSVYSPPGDQAPCVARGVSLRQAGPPRTGRCRRLIGRRRSSRLAAAALRVCPASRRSSRCRRICRPSAFDARLAGPRR